MAYEGEILYNCPSDIDFTVTQAVVVSGAAGNPCGHMLLAVGADSASVWYFHVAFQGYGETGILQGFPKFMRGDSSYNQYIQENAKYELKRLNANITNPNTAYQKLIEQMNEPWRWGVLINNCATFAKEIISAGGGDLTVLLNCPDQEFVNRLIDSEAEFQRENPGPKW